VIPTLYYQFPGKRGPTKIEAESSDVAEAEAAVAASDPVPTPMAK
jgi:hypothetical protein